jgi:carbon-monoxide dehydrogenase medium subunit
MFKPEYLAPYSVEEALQTLASQAKGMKIIAGGTDLIPQMRSGIAHPQVLIDLCKLPLNQIALEAGWIHIGSTATHTHILESDLLASHCPALVNAARKIAGPPIRNRGTIGGNLVNASPAADLALPLLAFDAVVVLRRVGGKREVSLAEFFTGPGQTVMSPDELLTEILIPVMPPGTVSSFIKLGKRKAMAIAVASVATRLSLDEAGKISDARIALGSVAPRPMRARTAEAFLVGKSPGRELFTKSADAASVDSSPIDDIRASGDYRKKMVAVLTRRALFAAWQQLEGRLP